LLTSAILHAFYFWFLSQVYATGSLSGMYPLARGTGVAGTALLASLLLREAISLNGWLALFLIMPESLASPLVQLAGVMCRPCGSPSCRVFARAGIRFVINWAPGCSIRFRMSF
jgi:hypothetical protein